MNKPKTDRSERARVYDVWVQMRRRCRDPRAQRWATHGGRGIKVCEVWSSFAAFFADMGPRPGPGYSIDRIDNDGDYEPDNCRWATEYEQGNNKRTNTVIMFGGASKTLAEWSRALPFEITDNTLYKRIFVKKWAVDRALTEPVQNNRRS